MLNPVKDTANLVPFPGQVEFRCDNDVIHSWLAEKSESTAKTYRNAVEQCLNWCGCDLKQLTLTSLQSYRSSLQDRYKVATARKKLSSVRSLLAFACDMGYLSHNPSTKLRNIQPSKEKTKVEIRNRAYLKSRWSETVIRGGCHTARLSLRLTEALLRSRHD